MREAQKVPCPEREDLGGLIKIVGQHESGTGQVAFV